MKTQKKNQTIKYILDTSEFDESLLELQSLISGLDVLPERFNTIFERFVDCPHDMAYIVQGPTDRTPFVVPLEIRVFQ